MESAEAIHTWRSRATALRKKAAVGREEQRTNNGASVSGRRAVDGDATLELPLRIRISRKLELSGGGRATHSARRGAIWP